MKKSILLVLFLLSSLTFAQLSGDYYIPQGANPQGFATLGEAVTSLNTLGASGTVNFILDADTLWESSFFTFNANLSAVNNVVVKPAPGRNVVLIVNNASASVGNGPFLIGFNKGYVTFDGSNDGSDSRNLLVTTEQLAPVVDLPFTLNHADADNIVLKNLIIKNIVVSQTNFRYGAVINDLGGVMGFRVENCQIGTAERPVRRDGLAPWGGSATANQFSFVNNEIYCGTRGVATIYLTNSEIIGNTINLLPTTAGNANSYIHGMYITGAYGTTMIKDNIINCLEKANIAVTYLIGIAFAGNGDLETDIISVINNMINIGAANETYKTLGIGFRSNNFHGNFKVYYNTILMNDNVSTIISYAIGHHSTNTGGLDVDLKNNIIINNHTGNIGSSAIGLVPATSVLTSDFNMLISAQNLVNFKGTNYANLAAWQAASGQDQYSASTSVTFVSATDLHLSGPSIGDVNLTGFPIASITTDIDGETRDGSYPYMGADENTATPLPVEMTTFTAVAQGQSVLLKWITAQEINSYKFDIERKTASSDWTKIGEVQAQGNSSVPTTYTFADNNLVSGKYSYRLKMIDNDGSFEYSKVVEAEVTVPEGYELSQNYPNPFNPSTKIDYSLPEAANVKILIYSVTGELVT
ncbi:MAG: hypothetical protein JW922_09390, partial [Paludibacteraceae bacterium]|nr:hypothetical protein [Paludibacteraceae bacterium]